MACLSCARYYTVLLILILITTLQGKYCHLFMGEGSERLSNKDSSHSYEEVEPVLTEAWLTSRMFFVLILFQALSPPVFGDSAL